ncbi:MAG: hypothetical protein Kow00114_36100 [Kiloniellaceae bacterium]
MPQTIQFDTPTPAEFEALAQAQAALEQRAAALENQAPGGGGSAGQTSVLHRAGWAAKIERVTYLPVLLSGSSWTNIASMEIPGPFKAGESLDLYFEVHGTNDDIRARGGGVAWVTQAFLAPDQTDQRNGYALNWANGTFNLGPEAHHGLICREGSHVFEADEPGPLYFKVMSHAKSTAAQSGDKLDISQWRGFMKARHFRI